MAKTQSYKGPNYADLQVDGSAGLFDSTGIVKNTRPVQQQSITNQDAYVDGNNPIMGQYSGSEVGSIPLFANGFARRLPIAMYHKIQSDLNVQKLQAIEKMNQPVKFQTPEIDSRMPDFAERSANLYEHYVNLAKTEDPKNWRQKLNDYSEPGTIGYNFRKAQEENILLANNYNELVNEAADAMKLSTTPGMFLGAEGFQVANEVTKKLGAFKNAKDLSNQNIDEARRKMKVVRSMQGIALETTKMIENNIQQEVAYRMSQQPNLKGIDVWNQVRKEYITDGRMEQVVKGLVQSNPASIYDDTDPKAANVYGAPFKASELKSFLLGLNGSTEINEQKVLKEATNTYISTGAKQVDNEPAAIIGATQMAVTNPAQMKHADGSITHPGSNGIQSVNGNNVTYIPFAHKNRIATTIAQNVKGVANPNATMINVGSSDAAQQELASRIPVGNPVDAIPLKTVDASNSIDWVTKNYGSLFVGDGVFVTKRNVVKSGNKNIITFTGLHNGGSPFEGIFMGERMVSDLIKLNPGWTRDELSIQFTGKQSVNEGRTLVEMPDDKLNYYVGDANGDITAAGGADSKKTIKISKSVFDKQFISKYNSAIEANKTQDIPVKATGTFNNVGTVNGNKPVSAVNEDIKKLDYTIPDTRMIGGVLRKILWTADKKHFKTVVE